jgi:hypothetical protein
MRDSGYRAHIITTRQTTAGEPLKYPTGFSGREAATTKAASILVRRHPWDTTERMKTRSSCTATTANGLS